MCSLVMYCLAVCYCLHVNDHFVLQLCYKPSKQILMDGARAHWWTHIFSTSNCESGKETEPSQLPLKFSLTPLLADQTTSGSLRAFFREAFILHGHVLYEFAESVCEHTGGCLELKKSFIVSFSDSLVTLRP